MTSPGHVVSEFLNGVTDWARHQPTLSGIALVGSYARGEARPDSDIDLVLLCTPPNAFLDNISWAQLFGEVAVCQTEEWRSHLSSGVLPEWAGGGVGHDDARMGSLSH
jgi:predicted nucleotidyltransferase